MGGFKRLCLFVFGLAGVLCLGALVLPWVGPYQQEAAGLMANDYYYLAVQVVSAITGLGVLIAFLRALFSPRKRKTIVVNKAGGDQISVSTDAICSQAAHVVEASGTLSADRVEVDTRRKGGVRVNVRVRPHETVNVVEEGQRLHDDLMNGLGTICGNKIRGVNLHFVEADRAEPEPAPEAEPQPIALETHVEPEPAAIEAAKPERTRRSLFSFRRPKAKAEPEAAVDEPAVEAEEETTAEERKPLTLDDLVVPASVYERAAQAGQQAGEAEAAAGVEVTVETGSASTDHEAEGITVAPSQLPSEPPVATAGADTGAAGDSPTEGEEA